MGISQDELAKRLGMSRNYVSMIEGGRAPSDQVVRHFALLEASPLNAAKNVVSDDHTSYGSDPRSALKRKREEMKLTHEQLAKISRVPAQYIQDVESGAVQGTNEKQLRKLAAALGLSPDALMSGSDHPPIVGTGITFGATPDVLTTGGIIAKSIPLIGMAQAGELVEFEDVYDHEGIVAYAGKDPKAIAVQIQGESMMPTYAPGTIAIVYPSFRPKNDNLVVAKVRDGSVLFKRLQIREGAAIFHSINPNYAPMEYAERDIVWMYPVGLTQKVEL